MSHSAAHSGHGRQNPKNGPAKRPASIAELAERARDDGWDETKEFKHHLRTAEKYRREGKECAKRGDLEGAFVELARAATLVLERLPLHRDYNNMLNANQRHNLALNGQDILDNLSDLKPALVDRYDKWFQKHGADSVDQERTPNARIQTIANDEARAQAQREQFQEEERARQVREQQRLAAEEAARWKQQREQMYARDEGEKVRRKEAAQAAARQAAANPRPPADYTFSRTPMQNNALGSQSTVVLADGRPNPPPPPDDIARQQQHQQQQEQMRLRGEEITRRQAEQKRKQESEGIARRQLEAEEAARAARQNLAPPPPPMLPTPSYTDTTSSSMSLASSSSPMFPDYNGSSAATTPSSTYFQQPIEYPTIHPPSAMQALVPSAPPNRQPGYLDPYASASRPMPLESPTKYEGDSTDSESVHHDYRKIGKLRPVIEYKTPTRPLRSPSYPPPITTTSPPPVIGYPALPALMSQHQRTQGYFPSLNSMFSDIGDRHHGGASVLFGSNANDARNNSMYPGAPPASASYVPHQYSNAYNGPNNTYGRPPQAAPSSAVPPQTAPPTQAEVARMPKPPNAVFDPNIPLKTVSLPRECLPRFLAIAKVNTEMNRETCGLLLGKDKGHKYAVTTLLIPKQHSTSDTCTMDEEELVLQFTEERSLITLGWIHTHPSQSCFMSSVDLHTHSGFQRMLPESFAVVCAPKSSPNFGIFRLTDPPGLNIILKCDAKEAFHPHPDEPIYTDADKGHVQMKDTALEIVDLR